MTSLRRDWAIFAAVTALFSFGFGIYNGLFQNFLRDVHSAAPDQLGRLESLREVPGLLTAFVAGSLVAWAEPRIGLIALGIMAVGLGSTGLTTSFTLLTLVTMLWSVGMHLWVSLSPAITLSLAKGREGGRHLGRMGGIGAVAGLAALAVTRLLKHFLPYSPMFIAAGVLILLAGVLCSFLSTHAESGPRARLVYRHDYRLYYLMTFLEGCRRQIFGTFASFALIIVYDVKVETMLTLAFVNAAAGVVSAPIVGRWMDRYGERNLMSAYYAALVLVFAGYAFVPVRGVLYGLFIVDNLLFAFGVGITTYLNRIVRSDDLTPTLAMGTTMNHIAAVLVPVTGGLLWKTTSNFRIPFYIGIVVVMVSLVVSRWLPLGPSRTHESANSGA